MSNLKRDIEERVSQYHPGLPYKDLPPSLQKRADGLTNDIINLIESVIPEEKVGTEKIPLNQAEIGYNIAIQDVNQAIKSKLIGKE